MLLTPAAEEWTLSICGFPSLYPSIHHLSIYFAYVSDTIAFTWMWQLCIIHLKHLSFIVSDLFCFLYILIRAKLIPDFWGWCQICNGDRITCSLTINFVVPNSHKCSKVVNFSSYLVSLNNPDYPFSLLCSIKKTKTTYMQWFIFLW